LTDFFTPERDRLGLRALLEEQKGLPMVLLIGDSISCGYTEGVMEGLRDVCNIRRAPDNCGDTRRGMKDLSLWVGDRKWELIHFNWGLHDLCYRHPESKVYGNRDKERGTISVPLEEYRANLETLVVSLKTFCSKLIWASTTFIPPEEAGRFQGDDGRYNKVAAEIMSDHGVTINDLHKLTSEFPPELFSCLGDVHFTKEGSDRIAETVSHEIRRHL